MTKYYNNKPLTSPEGVDSLSLEDPHGTVNHAIVRLVKTSLLDHLVLILNKQLDSLNGGSWNPKIMIFTTAHECHNNSYNNIVDTYLLSWRRRQQHRTA